MLYASTKSFLSSFGASLAAEVKSKGVDVLVVHPSPVATRFYDNAKGGTSMLDFFARFAVTADSLPRLIFGSVVSGDVSHSLPRFMSTVLGCGTCA